MRKNKSGFGLIEVLAAAVVFGFLFIGLNILQKGNREGVLRVRARDAANVIAQDVIDSISARGIASLKSAPRTGVCPTPSNPEGENTDLCRIRDFKGEAGTVPIEYEVTVNVIPIPENSTQLVDDQTEYIKALGNTSNLSVKHQIAKQIDVTVKWKFKNSDQSINVSSLVK